MSMESAPGGPADKKGAANPSRRGFLQGLGLVSAGFVAHKLVSKLPSASEPTLEELSNDAAAEMEERVQYITREAKSVAEALQAIEKEWSPISQRLSDEYEKDPNADIAKMLIIVDAICTMSRSAQTDMEELTAALEMGGTGSAAEKLEDITVLLEKVQAKVKLAKESPLLEDFNRS